MHPFRKAFVLFLFVAAALASPARTADASSSSWGGWPSPYDIISALPSGSLYFDIVSLLANATKLSYTATSGGYYENWTINETCGEGWIKSELFVQNPSYGMRALTFYNPSLLRVLIVYRGTDLTDDIGGLCDRCADQYLWELTPFWELPSECQAFGETTLDYFTNALTYAQEVVTAFDGYSVMFTGHSLGAGLAAAVATVGNEDFAWNKGALVFSAPGFLNLLENRAFYDLSNVDTNRVVLLADPWDPIWIGCSQASPYGGYYGSACLYNNSGAPSSACESCDSVPAIMPPNTTDCNTCMMERHAFGHYLLLRSTAPQCLSPNFPS